MVSALQRPNNQNISRGYVSMPSPIVLSNKVGPYTWSLEKKIHRKLCLQSLDQVCDISFWYPQILGLKMLKFTTMQLVDEKYVKGMISIIRQSEILQCCELYANIQLHTLLTPNPQYYPQSHYSQTSAATQDTFALTQPHHLLLYFFSQHFPPIC